MKMNAGVWIGIVAGLGALIFAVGTTLVNGGSLGIYIASGIVLMQLLEKCVIPELP